MAQKFSFRPGIANTRSRGRPFCVSHSAWRFFVDAELGAGGDFGAAENGDVQFRFGDGEPFGRSDQLPGVGDGVFFEIVAEGKIAEHFEKSVMALGEADIFQVVVLSAGADAFLRGGGAFVIALLEAEEDVLELVHPGVGEKQGGIAVRNERGAAHDAVAAFLEEFQEGGADFVAGHVSLRLRKIKTLSQRCEGSPIELRNWSGLRGSRGVFVDDVFNGGDVFAGDGAQFSAHDVGREAGAEEAAIEGSDFAITDFAAE